MNNEVVELIRGQYSAPSDMQNCDRQELIEYIKRLEQGVFELAQIRNDLYDELWKRMDSGEAE